MPEAYTRDELAAVAQRIEQEITGVLSTVPLDVPGPALLALLRISASLIALAPDDATLNAALECAHDILEQRARTHRRGTLH